MNNILSFYYRIIGFGVLLVFWIIPTAIAEPPKLDLPIDCTLKEDCWLVNLVDNDLGIGQRDYLCEKHTYNTHKGTDFAIRDLVAMEKGVSVIATAPGIVKALRDGIPDQFPDENMRRRRNIYCGNGVVIRHPLGWETQYCHLRKGSISVELGARVTRGQKLGLVGQSGMAEFPHVHLSVRHLGEAVDPFTGVRLNSSKNNKCGEVSASLWTKRVKRRVSHSMTSFFNAGFASKVPKQPDINKGVYKLKSLSQRSDALIFWVQAWWVRAGDTIRLRIISPSGRELLNNTSKITKLQSRHMRYAGKRRRKALWEPGKYTGIGELVRTSGGKTLRFSVQRKINIRN
ncbi:MAG: peptidase M23 [Magnetovibrio sp.]|nr:peptidase M23 [Magnetovibrio sp.]